MWSGAGTMLLLHGCIADGGAHENIPTLMSQLAHVQQLASSWNSAAPGSSAEGSQTLGLSSADQVCCVLKSCRCSPVHTCALMAGGTSALCNLISYVSNAAPGMVFDVAMAVPECHD
jgi:hypothetical protein